MKKEGSTASMLWLDIRRGFCSKRFWGIVGVVTIVFVVFLTLDIIYPLQKYYNGYGTFDWKLDSISMAPFAVRIGILSMDLFVTFFPFIGVIAYAGTIIDERKDGYCYQIIQKRGFHSYYWSHFVASGLLGGLLAVAILISLYLLTDIGIGQNPLWKDAIQVYLTPEFGSENETVYFGIHILTKSAGHVELVLLFVWVVRSDNCICIRCTGSCICNANDHYGDRVWGTLCNFPVVWKRFCCRKCAGIFL